MRSAGLGLVGMAALALCLLLPGSKGDAFAMQDIDLSEADNGKLITVDTGQPVSLRLPENPSTGYTWSIEAADGIRVQSSRFVPAAAPMIGTAGQHLWTLTPLKPGDLPVRAKLWRAWEGDRSVEQRFAITLRAVRGR